MEKAFSAQHVLASINGWLDGLVDDPLHVVRISGRNRDGENAGHVVRVCLAGAIDDLLDQAGAGMQGYPSLVIIMDLPSQR